MKRQPLDPPVGGLAEPFQRGRALRLTVADFRIRQATQVERDFLQLRDRGRIVPLASKIDKRPLNPGLGRGERSAACHGGIQRFEDCGIVVGQS